MQIFSQKNVTKNYIDLHMSEKSSTFVHKNAVKIFTHYLCKS